MRTFETMKTPPTRELADAQAQARIAPGPCPTPHAPATQLRAVNWLTD